MPVCQNAYSCISEASEEPVSGSSNVLSLAFTAALFLICAVPLIGIVLPIGTGFVGVNERRTSAPVPDPRLLFRASGDFAESLNAWFEDRFGFRDAMIRLKNQIDVSLFGISRKVYIGRNGWLFDRATTDQRLAFERLTEAQYLAYERSFIRLAQIVAARGAKLVVIDYPDKSAFYPELLPSNAPTIRADTKAERLRRFLAHETGIEFIDAAQLLLPLKRAGGPPPFYKTDIHVNLIGGIPVVQELIRRIARMEGRPDIAWDEKFSFKPYKWAEGVESRFMSVWNQVTEEVISAPDLYEIGKPDRGGSWIMNDPRRIKLPRLGDYPIFDWEHIREPCDGGLPGTVLFGNSFSDLYWSLGLQRYFCDIRRARTPIERLPAYIDDMPPGTRYFIFQFMEAYLSTDAPIAVFDSDQTVP